MTDAPLDAPLPEPKRGIDVANMSPLDLEEKRRQIVAKANGNWESLSNEDLRDLSIVISALRRRTAGPPKVAKKAGAKRAMKPKVDPAQILAEL